MGILDMLTSIMASKGASEIEAAVIPAILSEVLGNGGQGGLSADCRKAPAGRSCDQVKSWIGTGENLPISAQQLQQVLGQRYGEAARWALRHSGGPAFNRPGASSADRCRSRKPVGDTSAHCVSGSTQVHDFAHRTLIATCCPDLSGCARLDPALSLAQPPKNGTIILKDMMNSNGWVVRFVWPNGVSACYRARGRSNGHYRDNGRPPNTRIA